ncbi:MAG: LPP20 family lipoprotein [Bacteriovorax sp.]|nr:LPP20 family lipoprotein [Bacteriovorax sp.]
MKFLLVLPMFACLSAKAAAPDWFSDYVKVNPGCDKEYLCAVGVGATLPEALSDARSEVAKFFQNKIKSKTQVSSSSEEKSNQLGANASTGSFDEWTNKTISEETSEMISGLEIRKQEQAGDHTYVLLTLDRAKTATSLKEKIEELDTEDFQLLELNSRFAYPKMMKNLILIEALNDRYTLVSTIPLKIKVKKENLQAKIFQLKPVKMALVATGKKLPAKLNHLLVDLLSPLKVVIVSGKLAPKYTLRSEIVTEEQYLKVEGFKKLNVQFRLELLNSKSQVMGKMSALSEQVARNSDQAIEKAIPEIKETLQDNLDQLSNMKFED